MSWLVTSHHDQHGFKSSTYGVAYSAVSRKANEISGDKSETTTILPPWCNFPIALVCSPRVFLLFGGPGYVAAWPSLFLEKTISFEVAILAEASGGVFPSFAACAALVPLHRRELLPTSRMYSQRD